MIRGRPSVLFTKDPHTKWALLHMHPDRQKMKKKKKRALSGFTRVNGNPEKTSALEIPIIGNPQKTLLS